MPVNGGTGNAISLSEVQTFYGGSNPISMSEYYRGGSEVPSSVTGTITDGAVAASGAQGITCSGDQSGVSLADTGNNNSTSRIEFTVTPSTSGTWSYSGPSSYIGDSQIGFAGATNFGLSGSGSGSLTADTAYTLFFDITSANDASQSGFNFTWTGLGEVTYGAVTRTTTSDVSGGTEDTNTNVPASGVISLDTFNAPGNPSP